MPSEGVGGSLGCIHEDFLALLIALKECLELSGVCLPIVYESLSEPFPPPNCPVLVFWNFYRGADFVLLLFQVDLFFEKV